MNFCWLAGGRQLKQNFIHPIKDLKRRQWKSKSTWFNFSTLLWCRSTVQVFRVWCVKNVRQLKVRLRERRKWKVNSNSSETFRSTKSSLRHSQTIAMKFHLIHSRLTRSTLILLTVRTELSWIIGKQSKISWMIHKNPTRRRLGQHTTEKSFQFFSFLFHSSRLLVETSTEYSLLLLLIHKQILRARRLASVHA